MKYLDKIGLQKMWAKIQEMYIRNPQPSSPGQVLTKTEDGYAWQNPSSSVAVDDISINYNDESQLQVKDQGIVQSKLDDYLLYRLGFTDDISTWSYERIYNFSKKLSDSEKSDFSTQIPKSAVDGQSIDKVISLTELYLDHGAANILGLIDLNNYSFSDLHQIGDLNHKNCMTQLVGKTKTVTYNSTTFPAIVVGVMADTISGSSNKAPFTFQGQKGLTQTSYTGVGTVVSSSDNVGYPYVKLKTVYTTTIYNGFDSDLKSSLIAVDKKSYNAKKTASQGSVVTTSELVWPISGNEVGLRIRRYNGTSYSLIDDGSPKYEYYSSPKNMRFATNMKFWARGLMRESLFNGGTGYAPGYFLDVNLASDQSGNSSGYNMTVSWDDKAYTDYRATDIWNVPCFCI